VVLVAAMVHTVGEPIERKQYPRTAYEAKFSVPYTFASALLG
jgi:2-methylcitrate dehydratase PrpD